MNKLCIVMYHYVRELKDSRYPAIKALDYSLFIQQVKFLKEHFNIVTMEDVIEAYNSKTANLPENACLLTFDDGYIDCFTSVFPILKENNVQGSFFIPGKSLQENVLLDVNKIHFILACANPKDLVKDIFYQLDSVREQMPNLPSNKELFLEYGVESRFDDKETIFVKRILQKGLPASYRNSISSILLKKYVGVSERVLAKELYMNRDQIKCMKDSGMFIGIHGYDHYWLGNLNKEEMQQDIDKSLEIMDEFIDKNKWVINYPYGSYSKDVIEYIANKGCKLGLITKVKIADATDSKYELPRLNCNDFPPKSNAYASF